MKFYAVLCALIAAVMLLVPAVSLNRRTTKETATVSSVSEKAETPETVTENMLTTDQASE